MTPKALLFAAVALLPIASACIVTKVEVPVAPAIPAMSGNKAPDAYDNVSWRGEGSAAKACINFSMGVV